MRRLIVGLMPLALAGAVLVCGSGSVYAQGRTGGGGAGGGGGGSSLGGSFGGSGGSSMGSSGSAFGGSSSSSTGSRTGGSSGSSTNANYGSTSFLGTNYYNPLSFGLTGTTSSNGQSSIGGSSSTSSLGGASGSSGASSSSSSNSTIKAATSSVKFGQALYNVNPVSTFTQPTSSGTASIRANTSASQNTNPSPVRVSYTARVGFTPARVPMSQVVSEFQQSIAASPELSNPSNRVELVVDGNTVVLRGVVQDARERALAETLASLTPGVRGVRNELAVRDNNPDGMAAR